MEGYFQTVKEATDKYDGYVRDNLVAATPERPHRPWGAHDVLQRLGLINTEFASTRGALLHEQLSRLGRRHHPRPQGTNEI